MDPLEMVAEAVMRDELEQADGVAQLSDLDALLADRLETYLGTDTDQGDMEDLAMSVVYGPGPLVSLGDGRVCDAVDQTWDVALTHRLSADEIDDGHLDLDVDLALLAEVAASEGGLHLPDARPLRFETRRSRGTGPGGTDVRGATLHGPARWLRSFSAGQMVAVTVANGMADVQPVAAEVLGSVTDEMVAAVEAAADAHAPGEPADGTPRSISTLQAAALVDGWWPGGPTAPPFGEVIAASTLSNSGDHAGRADAWPRLARITEVLAPTVRNQQLPGEALTMLSTVIKAWQDHEGAGVPTAPQGLASTLYDVPELVDALLPELRRLAARRPGGDDLLAAYLTDLHVPSGRRAAGVLSLQATWALACGDLVQAEQLVQLAERADPHHHPAVELHAQLAANRGDLQATVRLLSRVRMPEDPELQKLGERLAAMSPNIGRNDPCPCGSGRKYKQCHLGRNELPTATAVMWLLDQVRDFIDLVAEPSSVFGPLDDLGEDIDPISTGATVAAMDLAIFEHGWLQRFLDQRGPILSAEHRALAATWITDHRPAVYDVEHLDQHGATLVDRATGEGLDVVASRALEAASTGSVVWARLVPARGRWCTSGLCLVLDGDSTAARFEAARATGSDAAWLRAVLGRAPEPPPLAEDGEPRVHARTWIKHQLTEAELRARFDAAFPKPDGEEVGNSTWLATTKAGLEVRVNVPGLLLGPEATATIDAAEEQAHLLDVIVLGQSIPGHRAVVDQVLGLLESEAGEPTVVHDDLMPWRRWAALGRDEDLLHAVDRDPWDDDDWDDDEG